MAKDNDELDTTALEIGVAATMTAIANQADAFAKDIDPRTPARVALHSFAEAIRNTIERRAKNTAAKPE